jgi:hypothetical protein
MNMADRPSGEGQARAQQREKADPTIKQGGVVASYPEGTHPIRPLKEQTYAAVNKEYKDMPDEDKPDPSTVAQYEVPLEDRSSSK